MSNGDTGFKWQLPAAPGQVGYQAPPDPQPREDPNAQTPFGFRHMAQMGLGTPPYVPSWQNPATRGRPPSDWGSNDWVRDGMDNFPEGEIPAGMYVPNEEQIGGIFRGAAHTLGQYGSPGVAIPAAVGGANYLKAVQAYQQGQKRGADLYREQAITAFTISQQRLQEQVRKYGNAFAAFGSWEGNNWKGDEDKLRDRVQEIATEYGDHFMQTLLDNHDMKSIENLIHHMDGTGQDVGKALKLLQTEEAAQKVEKGRREEQERKQLEDIQKIGRPGEPERGRGQVTTTPSDTDTVTAPVSPDAKAPADATTEKGPAVPPEGSPEHPGGDSTEAPDDNLNFLDDNGNAVSPELGEAKPAGGGGTALAAAAPAAARGGAPTSTMGAIQQGIQTAQATPRQAAPIQLAQADTGVVSDAPPPGARRAAETAPKPDREDADQPSVVDQPYTDDVIRQSRAALDLYKRNKPRSGALEYARTHNLDPGRINQLGLDRANRTMTVQDFRTMSKAEAALSQVRRLEIEEDMRNLRTNFPKIKGNDVYEALATINPDFASTLKNYVDGAARIPASAWHNPAYRDNILKFGRDIDPAMTEFRFKSKADTIANFTHGKAWTNTVAIGTAFRHIDLLKAMVPGTPHAPGVFGDRYASDWAYQTLQEYFGRPGETRDWIAGWGTVADTAADEIAKANASAGGSTQGDRLEWRSKFNSAKSESEKMRVINEAEQLMLGKLDMLGATYKAGTGRDPERGISEILKNPRSPLTGDQVQDAARVRAILDRRLKNRGWDATPE